MSVRLLLLAFSCLVVAPPGTAFSEYPAVPERAGLVEHPCWFAVDEPGVSAACYWMFVPEEHGNSASMLIGFPVVHLSRGRSDLPPVLHLGGGGPGNALHLSAGQITGTWQNHFYMSLDAGMDLLLMDPRGVGLAMPRLNCHEWLGTVRDTWRQPLSLQREWEIGLAADRQCVQRITGAGHNLAMYNSAAVAQDVEALRKALGVSQWNLYGVSYGSRYALTIARDFPHSVAAMVLDGAVFPHLRYEEKGAVASELAIRRAFSHCNSDAGCRADFPAIEERFWALTEAFNKQPLQLTVTDPDSYEPLQVSLTGYRLFSILFYAAYDEGNHGQFPALVRSLEHRNTDLVAPHVRRYLRYLLDPGDSDAALATHYCYEEHPFMDSDRLLTAARGFRAVIRDPLVQTAASSRAWCDTWLGETRGPALESQPVHTDVPTLVLHGELDPVLPVEDVRTQLSTLQNAVLLTYPGIAHDVVSSSLCAEATAGRFYQDPAAFARAEHCSE